MGVFFIPMTGAMMKVPAAESDANRSRLRRRRPSGVPAQPADASGLAREPPAGRRIGQAGRAVGQARQPASPSAAVGSGSSSWRAAMSDFAMRLTSGAAGRGGPKPTGGGTRGSSAGILDHHRPADAAADVQRAEQVISTARLGHPAGATDRGIRYRDRSWGFLSAWLIGLTLSRRSAPSGSLVRAVGIEPTLCHQNRILSPARLPVPPRPREGGL